MSAQIVMRQKTLSIALIIAGVMAFAVLLTLSGMIGHVLSLFGISYADARAVVLAIINNYIGSLPWWQQIIAHAVEAVVRILYHAFGLQRAVAY